MEIAEGTVDVVAADDSPAKATAPTTSLSSERMTNTGGNLSAYPRGDMSHGRRDLETGNSCSSGQRRGSAQAPVQC
jgi:hypothetical protein